MPYATELAGFVHAAQMAAVTKAQDLAVATVRQVADMRDRAPKVPAPVDRLTTPLAATWAGYRSDWSKVNESFVERLKEAAQRGTKTAGHGSRPTVVKSTAKKSSAKG